jgi:hypothetical protein
VAVHADRTGQKRLELRWNRDFCLLGRPESASAGSWSRRGACGTPMSVQGD